VAILDGHTLVDFRYVIKHIWYHNNRWQSRCCNFQCKVGFSISLPRYF